jgi:hypothetical protein
MAAAGRAQDLGAMSVGVGLPPDRAGHLGVERRPTAPRVEFVL